VRNKPPPRMTLKSRLNSGTSPSTFGGNPDIPRKSRDVRCWPVLRVVNFGQTHSPSVGMIHTPKNRIVFGSGRSQTRSNRQKPDSGSRTRTRPRLRTTIVANMGGKSIMTPGYVTADFAIKAGYFFVGALVLIFVGMLVLTAAHP
jgi:hypothetical protein